MVTANVSPERQTSPQNGKRPARAACNGKRSPRTANVPESQISSNRQQGMRIRFTYHLQAQLSRVGYNLRAEVVKTVCAKLVVYR